MLFKKQSFSKELITLIPRLRRYAMVLSNSKHDAEDLLQATLERALVKQQQWKKDSHLDRWTFIIMSSLWKNKLRHDGTRKGNGLSHDVDVLTDTDAINKIERTFLYMQVFKEVMILPEDHREAILLVYIEGMSYQEAADILSIPLGTLMSRLARARTSLANKFTDKTASATIIKLDERRG